jgi:hypothetical protein
MPRGIPKTKTGRGTAKTRAKRSTTATARAKTMNKRSGGKRLGGARKRD